MKVICIFMLMALATECNIMQPSEEMVMEEDKSISLTQKDQVMFIQLFSNSY